MGSQPEAVTCEEPRSKKLASVTALSSAGRDASFEEFYAASFQDLVRLAALLVGSVPVAEDLVQDSFVKVHRHWGRIEAPLPYTRRAVVNACNSHHRRRFLERRHAALVVEPVQDLGASELADALGALPAKQRAAVVLRFYEDLTEVDTAAVLGCRPGTVGSLLHRAMATLRSALSEYGDQEDRADD